MLNEQIRVVNLGKIVGGEAVEVVRTRNFIVGYIKQGVWWKESKRSYVEARMYMMYMHTTRDYIHT